jgi:hypothetical protein
MSYGHDQGLASNGTKALLQQQVTFQHQNKREACDI